MMHNINTVGHRTSIMEDRKGISVPANTIPFTGTHWPVNVMVYRKHWGHKKGVLATIK
jgi:murein endopeptidase